MKVLDYGVVAEFDNSMELWLEPITDEIDGFVLRDKGGNGIAMFPESKWGGERRWSKYHDKKYNHEL